MAGGIIIGGKVLTEKRLAEGRHHILLDGELVGAVVSQDHGGFKAELPELGKSSVLRSRPEAVAWIVEQLRAS
jgi:hypothetical protein